MNLVQPANGISPVTTCSPFRAFIENHRQALVLGIVAGLRELFSNTAYELPDEVLRERVDAYISSYLDQIEQPNVASRWKPNGIELMFNRQMEASALLRIITVYRQHFTDYALQAVGMGVPGASDALKTILSVLESESLVIVNLHKNFLDQDFHQQSNELRATRSRLEQSLLNTPLATIEWDNAGIVRFWNPSAERIFGWSAEEAIGQNIVRLLVPDIALEHVQGVVDALLSGQVANSRNLNLTKSGKIITCQWYNAVLRNEAGEVTGALSQTEDVSEQLRSEEERLALQQQVIDAQSVALRELSTPLIPLADGVVAMPLIGSIDSTRSQQVIEHLLEGVNANHARLAILDITGVPVVDTQVANALLRAAQAVKLLGAQVVLTGIRPEVAQTLVGLGVDMRGIITRSTLQSGIAFAFSQH